MNRRQLEEAARKLDHLGMTAMWEENKRLRGMLEHAMEMIVEDDDCEECREIRKFLRVSPSTHAETR